jgi:hypothetical protein|tara:strand:+ start:5899 stop:7464 length:1566 start_codon:yes stop_codon:yes gene_type:complete
MTTRVDGINIKDGDITEAKLQTSLNPSGTIDSNAFNIGVLGFKVAVNDGLTVFNLIDGVVDEFHDNTGVDTAENSNAIYDATSDFFENKSAGPVPNTTEITSYTSGSGNYTAEPTTTNVNVLIVGGGGAGGGSASDGTGGGGAGGLIYYPNYPVTGGNSYAYVVGAGMGETPAPGGPHPTFGYNGADSSFNHPSPLPLVGEGGGKGGDSQGFPQSHFLGRPGGSGGGIGGKVPDMGVVPAYQPVGEKFGSDALPLPATGLPTTPSPQGPHYIGTSTQVSNHPTGLSPSVLPVNSPGGFGNRGGAGSQATPQTPPDGHRDGGGGGGAGAIGNDNLPTEPQNSLNPGGVGLAYTIADGSSPVTYATGGNSGPEGVSGAGADASANTGNGGTGGGPPGTGGTGGSGIVIVSASQQQVSSSSMTLISDTFTANTAPSTARIVIFAELGDDINSEISASVTRDNTTFNSVTLTDEGYSAGSSGIKIFSGSTPLTGSASPQVRLRWKIVGSSLEGANKIHGVSLQWK